MTNEKLNMQPVHELLKKEVELTDLIKYLDSIFYYFTEFSLKTSCYEDVSIEKEVVICSYWIGRLKQMFEEMKN